MENCMYWDGWLSVEKKDSKTAYIVNGSGLFYLEISMKVARYLVERLEGSMENGYKVVDRIEKIRGRK